MSTELSPLIIVVAKEQGLTSSALELAAQAGGGRACEFEGAISMQRVGLLHSIGLVRPMQCD